MNPEKTPPVATESVVSPAPQPVHSKARGVIKEIILFIIIAGGVILPFRQYVAKPYLVDGRSMHPTFATDDYLIVDEISSGARTPERNSVVVFSYPGDNKNNPDRNILAKIFNPGVTFIKRVIGLPGETVIMKDGVVTIINAENPEGFIIDQSYVKDLCTKKFPDCINSFTKTLAGDEYYVMGDNRAESYDSRYWGPLKKQYIIGKPVLRLFGIKRGGIIPLPMISKFGVLPGADNK